MKIIYTFHLVFFFALLFSVDVSAQTPTPVKQCPVITPNATQGFLDPDWLASCGDCPSIFPPTMTPSGPERTLQAQLTAVAGTMAAVYPTCVPGTPVPTSEVGTGALIDPGGDGTGCVPAPTMTPVPVTPTLQATLNTTPQVVYYTVDFTNNSNASYYAGFDYTAAQLCTVGTNVSIVAYAVAGSASAGGTNQQWYMQDLPLYKDFVLSKNVVSTFYGRYDWAWLQAGSPAVFNTGTIVPVNWAEPKYRIKGRFAVNDAYLPVTFSFSWGKALCYSHQVQSTPTPVPTTIPGQCENYKYVERKSPIDIPTFSTELIPGECFDLIPAMPEALILKDTSGNPLVVLPHVQICPLYYELPVWEVFGLVVPTSIFLLPFAIMILAMVMSI